MPSKKTKFNSRFPPARIKKIMQTDKEVGKVAAAVPVLISKALEHFIEALLLKASQQTQEKNAKTLTPSHIKQCINREKVFDFLKDLVEDVPDLENVTENSNSTGQERRGHKNNRRRTWRKDKASKSRENSSSEEESVTDSGEEDPSSANATSWSSGHPETSQMPHADSGERMTTSVESHQPGPSSADQVSTAPSIGLSGPLTQPTNSAIPMGEYRPRGDMDELGQEEDYDT